MRVDWAVPCRYTEVHDNLATIIGGGISLMWPPLLPAPIGLMLAIRIVFLKEEVDETHTLRVSASSPSGQTVAQVESPLNLDQGVHPIEPPDDELLNAHLPMVVQFPATEEGLYMLDVTVDDSSVGVPIRVHTPPQPPS